MYKIIFSTTHIKRRHALSAIKQLSNVLQTKNMSNTFPKKHKNITHKISAIVPNNSKRSRVSTATALVSKYKHK